MATDANSENKQSNAGRWVIAGVVAAAVIIGLWFLFRGNTTTTKTGGTDYADTSTLSCMAGNIENGTFDTSSAISTSYSVTAIFHDDQLYNLNYVFKGEYSDEATAKTAEAVMHADFNISLANSGLSGGRFSSENWSVSGNEVNILILADSNEILPHSADELMIDVEDPDSENPHIPNSVAEVKSNYVKRGFICKVEE